LALSLSWTGPLASPSVSLLASAAVGTASTEAVWSKATGKVYAATPEAIAVLSFEPHGRAALEVEEVIPAGTSSSDGIAISSRGSFAYIAAGLDGLQVVDLRARKHVGSYRIDGWSGGIVLDPLGNAVVAADPGLLSFDVARPASPLLLNHCDVNRTSGGGHGWNVAWGGACFGGLCDKDQEPGLALLADNTGGLRVIHVGLGMEVSAHFGMGTLAHCEGGK